MSTPFLTYAFKADLALAGVARNTPVRLTDRVNVKDWGALGDGTTDDTIAISKAIAFAGSTGIGSGGKNMVWFPPGTYAIGNPGGVPTRLHLSGSIVGSGRDVTILTGNFSEGDPNPGRFDEFAQGWLANDPRFICWSDQNQLDYLADLTIRNESVTPGSGAYFIAGTPGAISPMITNCHFVGICGLHAWLGQFGMDVHNCKATCIIAKTRADVDSGRSPYITNAKFPADGPIAGTVGFYIALGGVFNCRAEGFDIGYAFANAGGPTFAGNIAYRCDTPFYVGNLNKDAGHVVVVMNQTAQSMAGGVMFANISERCLSYFNFGKASQMGIAGNCLVAGAEGPYERAPIADMQYNGTTHIVTVTTSAPHNLTSSNIRLFVTGTGWTPDSSGVVTALFDPGDPTHFIYTLLTAPSTAFGSAEWNYVAVTGLSGFSVSQMFIAANTAHVPWDTGVSLPVSVFATECNNVIMAMRGPRSFIAPNHDEFPAAWSIIMCGKGGSNPPVPRMRFTSLPDVGGGESTSPQGPFDGQTYNIVDGSGAGTFGSTVAGSGFGHWKVRYDGTNWVRIG